MSIPANELVDATIRSELEQGDRTLASEHVLTRFTGHVLFERRWFAPRELVADCALDVIRLDPSIREEGQEALINTYRSQVIDEGRRIAYALEQRLEEPLALEFAQDLAAAFGVNDELAPNLSIAIHESPTEDRLGLLLPVSYTHLTLPTIYSV